MSAHDKLNPQLQLFVSEYLLDNNMRRAAGAAGISKNDHRILDRPGVREAIEERREKRAEVEQIAPSTILREIYMIAMADVNEIVSYRRVNCRYCYGRDFKYQYSTERDLRIARYIFEASPEGFVDIFEHGGTGFEPMRSPNEDCPYCAGDGVGDVHIRDTRTLSPSAKALFAGIKVTKDGIEVKLHDKSKHLELLARHLGLLNDKLDVNLKSDLAERLVRGRKRVGGDE